MERNLLINNIERCGFRPEHLKFPEVPIGKTSRVWVFTNENDQIRIAKLHPKWMTRQDIDWMNVFTLKLREKGLPLAYPLSPFIHTNEGFMAVYNYIEGEDYKQNNQNHITAMGIVLSKMHHLGSQITINGERNWPGVARSKFTERYAKFNKSLEKISNTDIKEYLDQSIMAFETAKESIANIEQQLAFPIHGDFHGENMKFSENKVEGVFDFDNARNDYPEADIAKIVRKLIKGNPDEYQRTTLLFLHAYSEPRKPVRVFPEYILASLLSLGAQEVLYLIQEYLEQKSSVLWEDIEIEVKLLSKITSQQTELMNLFQDGIQTI